MVYDKLWHMVERGRWMRRHNLIVLYSRVSAATPTASRFMSNLHEKTTRNSLSYVDVVSLVFERQRNQVQVEALHCSLQLLAYIICLDQRAV